MKINFENYEIVRAESGQALYPAYPPIVTKYPNYQKMMAEMKKRCEGKCDKDKAMAVCKKITAVCKTKMKGVCKDKDNMKAMFAEIISAEDNIILETLLDLLYNNEETCNEMDMMDDEEVEACYAEISDEQQMLEILNCGFRPTIGSFTVGHSLAALGEPNRNGDMVMDDKGQFWADCLVGQACTWQHDAAEIVGSIVNTSKYKNIVLANTKFWESRFDKSQMVEAIKDKYNKKDLKFSFENMVGKVACAKCGNEYPAVVEGKKEHYCEHLKGRYALGSQAGRILVDFIPIGEGVVNVPAYAQSKALVAANMTEVARLAQAVEKLNAIINKKLK